MQVWEDYYAVFIDSNNKIYKTGQDRVSTNIYYYVPQLISSHQYADAICIPNRQFYIYLLDNDGNIYKTTDGTNLTIEEQQSTSNNKKLVRINKLTNPNLISGITANVTTNQQINQHL
jgi:hypothetical protein